MAPSQIAERRKPSGAAYQKSGVESQIETADIADGRG